MSKGAMLVSFCGIVVFSLGCAEHARPHVNIDPRADEALCKMSAALQYLGEDRVDGDKCYHLIYTVPDVNWEIWIKKDGDKIPRKAVITYPNAPGRPQYVIHVTHFEAPLIMWGADFDTNPPSGATSATMASLAGGAPSQ